MSRSSGRQCPIVAFPAVRPDEQRRILDLRLTERLALTAILPSAVSVAR